MIERGASRESKAPGLHARFRSRGKREEKLELGIVSGAYGFEKGENSKGKRGYGR
jgi:hypothetical protein